MIESNARKVERALQEAMVKCGEKSEYITEQEIIEKDGETGEHKE